MLQLVIAFSLFMAAGLVLGYLAGVAAAYRTLSRTLQEDREAATRMLELLAQRWGARLEMFGLPSQEPPAPPPS